MHTEPCSYIPKYESSYDWSVCRASDISACVDFIILHLAVHAYICIACYTHVLDATHVYTRGAMSRVFLSLQYMCVTCV